MLLNSQVASIAFSVPNSYHIVATAKSMTNLSVVIYS